MASYARRSVGLFEVAYDVDGKYCRAETSGEFGEFYRSFYDNISTYKGK